MDGSEGGGRMMHKTPTAKAGVLDQLGGNDHDLPSTNRPKINASPKAKARLRWLKQMEFGRLA